MGQFEKLTALGEKQIPRCARDDAGYWVKLIHYQSLRTISQPVCDTGSYVRDRRIYWCGREGGVGGGPFNDARASAPRAGCGGRRMLAWGSARTPAIGDHRS